MGWWDWAVVATCGLAAVPAGLRWLRIAQREHYLAPAVTRFSIRWWTAGPANLGMAAAALAGAAGEWIWMGVGLVAAAVEAWGPLGLGLKGSTGSLAWTGRLVRAAVTAAVLMGVMVVFSILTARPAVAAGALVLLPALVDLALAVNAPLEKALSEKWVKRAARRLEEVSPKVVAITGSYGKTSTKLYLAHLLSGRRRTVASPASFNNRMGLARAINERLVSGTEVFVAEMGTYGPGEIAELCGWIPPRVAMITAIGPVHLERMRTEERILAAKQEILTEGATAVLGVDHPGLADLAEAEAAGGRRVIRCSGKGNPCGVAVHPESGEVQVEGATIGRVEVGRHHPLNVAAAVGAVAALDINPVEVAERLATLPSPEHRLSAMVTERGVTILDDTFNANPAGARAALRSLVEHASPEGKRVVVTPGLVEMGSRRRIENRTLGESAGQAATHLLIVGRTNRRDLLRGAREGPARVLVLSDRSEAVEWARANLDRGDVILYENDLPDHYP